MQKYPQYFLAVFDKGFSGQWGVGVFEAKQK